MDARRPSIALVLGSSSEVSGSSTVARFLDLLGRGWDAHLLCGRGGAEWTELLELPEPILRRRVHPPPRHLRGRMPRGALALGLLRVLGRNPVAAWCYLRVRRLSSPRRYLDAVLIALRPQLVHFHSGPSARERIGAKRVLRCKVVVSFRPGDLRLGVDTPEYYRSVWDEADVLHLPAEAMWERARLRGCPSTSARAVIPPPATEPDESDPQDVRSASEQRFRILSVGPLSWAAGYEYALQAVRLLIDRGTDCEYWVVGEGEYADAVSFARYQLGLEANVHLLGKVDREEATTHMLWADVLLDSGVTDGYSDAITEALLLELPVVTTHRRSRPPPPAPDDQIFLVPKRDPEALAEKLGALAADPGRRRRVGEAERLPADQRPSLEDYLAELDDLYRRTLA